MPIVPPGRKKEAPGGWVAVLVARSDRNASLSIAEVAHPAGLRSCRHGRSILGIIVGWTVVL